MYATSPNPLQIIRAPTWLDTLDVSAVVDINDLWDRQLCFGYGCLLLLLAILFRELSASLIRPLPTLCSIFGRRWPTWLVGFRGERPQAAGRGVRVSGRKPKGEGFKRDKDVLNEVAENKQVGN